MLFGFVFPPVSAHQRGELKAHVTPEGRTMADRARWALDLAILPSVMQALVDAMNANREYLNELAEQNRQAAASVTPVQHATAAA
jgi:hypothetical protein